MVFSVLSDQIRVMITVAHSTRFSHVAYKFREVRESLSLKTHEKLGMLVLCLGVYGRLCRFIVSYGSM